MSDVIASKVWRTVSTSASAPHSMTVNKIAKNASTNAKGIPLSNNTNSETNIIERTRVELMLSPLDLEYA